MHGTRGNDQAIAACRFKTEACSLAEQAIDAEGSRRAPLVPYEAATNRIAVREIESRRQCPSVLTNIVHRFLGNVVQSRSILWYRCSRTASMLNLPMDAGEASKRYRRAGIRPGHSVKPAIAHATIE